MFGEINPLQMASGNDQPEQAAHVLESMTGQQVDHGTTAAARAIVPRDREVDALNREILAALVQHMMEHPDTIARCLHWIVAAKSLERIADHAKNIAEEAVYLCEAQDIRHNLKR